MLKIMNNIILYSAITGISLVIGAITGLLVKKINQKVVAITLAFGAGILICALTFGLMEAAFSASGFWPVVLGFFAGGLIFVIVDLLLINYGGRNHKRKTLLFKTKNKSNILTMFLSTILDSVPKAIAVGVATFAGLGTGLLIAVSISLASIPESLSTVEGFKKEGFAKSWILATWIISGAILFFGAVFVFVFLHFLIPQVIGIIEAFAAGAVLAMLADIIMPEAYENGGFPIGLVTILGFLLAFILTKI